MGNPVDQTEEQQIAAKRLSDLEAQASRSATDAQTAKAEALGLQGDLDRANVQIAALRGDNERLTVQLNALNTQAALKDALPVLPADMPKGAFQLLESVTIATLTDDGKLVRTNAKRGDVVVGGAKPAALEELQSSIGKLARVHAVDRSTLDELKKLAHIR